jgi:hypothetical protein
MRIPLRAIRIDPPPPGEGKKAHGSFALLNANDILGRTAAKLLNLVG